MDTEKNTSEGEKAIHPSVLENCNQIKWERQIKPHEILILSCSRLSVIYLQPVMDVAAHYCNLASPGFWRNLK